MFENHMYIGISKNETYFWQQYNASIKLHTLTVAFTGHDIVYDIYDILTYHW